MRKFLFMVLVITVSSGCNLVEEYYHGEGIHVCSDSSYKCDNNTLMRCENNAWVEKQVCEENYLCSSDEKRCVPTGNALKCDTEGALRCNGAVLERCQSGRWTLRENCGERNGVCESNNKRCDYGPPKCSTGCDSVTVCVNDVCVPKGGDTCQSTKEGEVCVNGQSFPDGIYGVCESKCSDRFVCISGVCVPRSGPKECSHPCDEKDVCVNGKCVPRGNVACEGGCSSGVCLNGTCIPGTNTEACEHPASDSEVCLNGKLIPKGAACTDDCGSGEVCVNAQCLSEGGNECENACAGGDVCFNGKCSQRALLGDSAACTPECGENMICISGVCVSTKNNLSCSDKGKSCPDHFECLNGSCVHNGSNRCIPECEDNKVCVSGVCVDKSGFQLCKPECGNGKICLNGVCTESGNCDHCSGDQICVAGTCVKKGGSNVCEPACDEVCINETCLPKGNNECTKTCKPHHVCLNGQCIPGGSNEICQPMCNDGIPCLNGVCIEPELLCIPLCKEGFRCDLGKCVKDGCTTDDDCKADDMVCDTAKSKCVACFGEKNCKPGKYCFEAANPEDNHCVDCLTPEHCESVPGKPVCDSEEHICIAGCNTDDDCSSTPDKAVCGSNHRCVACEKTEHCKGENKICHNMKCENKCRIGLGANDRKCYGNLSVYCMPDILIEAITDCGEKVCLLSTGECTAGACNGFENCPDGKVCDHKSQSCAQAPAFTQVPNCTVQPAGAAFKPETKFWWPHNYIDDMGKVKPRSDTVHPLKEHPTFTNIMTIPLVIDMVNTGTGKVESDKIPEIVIMSFAGSQWHEGVIRVLNSQTGLEIATTKNIYSPGGAGSITAADLDADGIIEIIAFDSIKMVPPGAASSVESYRNTKMFILNLAEKSDGTGFEFKVKQELLTGKNNSAVDHTQVVNLDRFDIHPTPEIITTAGLFESSDGGKTYQRVKCNHLVNDDSDPHNTRNIAPFVVTDLNEDGEMEIITTSFISAVKKTADGLRTCDWKGSLKDDTFHDLNNVKYVGFGSIAATDLGDFPGYLKPEIVYTGMRIKVGADNVTYTENLAVKLKEVKGNFVADVVWKTKPPYSYASAYEAYRQYQLDNRGNQFADVVSVETFKAKCLDTTLDPQLHITRALKSFCGMVGGRPVVADTDNDGVPDIGIATGSMYYTIDGKNGLPKWVHTGTYDQSMLTGATVFDFDGNGTAEVIYGDEIHTHVFAGQPNAGMHTDPDLAGIAKAEPLFVTLNNNKTLSEYPVVADIDNDGKADLLITSNNYAACKGDPKRHAELLKINGLRVFSDDKNWVGTRSLWNQYNYYIVNVEDDGKIPATELTWSQRTEKRFVSLRQNMRLKGQATDAPHFVAGGIDFSHAKCPEIQIRAHIGNAGQLDALIPVEFFGNKGSVATSLGKISVQVAHNGSAFAILDWAPGIENYESIHFVIDPEDTVPECDAASAKHRSDPVPVPKCPK